MNAPENPRQIKDAARKYVKPLVWSDGYFDSEWHAFGVSEHAIYLENGLYVYWEEGEGPKYTTLEDAKEAVNQNHIEEVMRLFDWSDDV